MKTGIFTRDKSLLDSKRMQTMLSDLESAGIEVLCIDPSEELKKDLDLILSVGGDGTFLSASKKVGSTGIPIMGVNLGRLGFLSEYSPEEACAAILSRKFSVEDRELLATNIDGEIIGGSSSYWPYALNEISVHRSGAAILGIDIMIDGNPLPTYWADGLLVATSSGSTAYSLSVGGPICTPDSKVLIVAPIAPHNLNVRPLIVPDSTKISISMQSRDDSVMMSMDNRNILLSPSASISVEVAQFSLKRVRLEKSSFFKALTTKLFWGEDIRNSGEQ